MSTRTGVRALVMVTLCYGALEIVGLLLLLLLVVCRSTRTRGYTRTRPVPAGRVGYGSASHGSGQVLVGSPRVRVHPVLPVRKMSFHDSVTRKKTLFLHALRLTGVRPYRPQTISATTISDKTILATKCSLPASLFGVIAWILLCFV